MIHCIIVDDEPLALDLLEDNIKRIPFLKLVARCNNALEAIQLLQSIEVDLVFTDIQMPGLNGMDFIATSPNKPMFILNTAYEKYALDGYQLDVIDYLLKPVSFERFVLACNKALERFNLKKLKMDTSGSIHPSKNKINYFFVNVDYSLVKVHFNDVKYIEGQRDYIKIHFVSNKKALLVRLSMKGVEEMLPSDTFIRIHKSYIINTNYVTAVRKNAVFLSELEFTISDQFKDAIVKITKGNTLI